MLKRLMVFLFVFALISSACGQGDGSAEEPDTEATVAAALSATQAAAPTETAPAPTDTPQPPTATAEPEPSPTTATQPEPSPTTETAETQTLDLDEATVAFSPQEQNFATELTFRLSMDDQVVSEMVFDGITNANGNSAITYDFSNADVAPTAAVFEIIERDGTTYFNLPDGTCVSSGMGDLPIGDMALDAGTILLDTENMVTGQLQWNGVTEVNGVSTHEYLIDADNLVDATGITNMTNGVLNVAEDGNYVVRLILEGSGESELLAPGTTGDLYYELNLTPSETPFEIEVPENCVGPGDVGGVSPGDGDEDGDGDGDGGTGDDDTGGQATGEIVITQVAGSVSRQCQGEDVIVEGANNTITLTGTCNKVVVHSAGNTMDIEAASAIVVNGAGNTITYGGSPAITDNGLGNTFNQR